MESKKLYFFKIFASIFFASAVLGAFAYVCIKGDVEFHALSFSCVAACFLFSLMFIRLTAKKILFTIALELNAVADIFLVMLPNEKNMLIGVCLMAGVQAIYFVYTLFLFKGNGMRAISLALRVALCLLAYFLLPKYFALTTIQLIYAMIVINSFITLLTFLFFLKTQWLTFLGFLLFFAYNFFSALGAGWAIVLKFPADFLMILANPFWLVPGLGFIFYLPGVLLLALSSVWDGKATGAKVFRKKTVSNLDSKISFETSSPLQNNNAQSGTASINRPTKTDGVDSITLDDL